MSDSGLLTGIPFSECRIYIVLRAQTCTYSIDSIPYNLSQYLVCHRNFCERQNCQYPILRALGCIDSGAARHSVH